MQANVLVLDHDPLSLEFAGDKQILGQVLGGRMQTPAYLRLRPIRRKVDAIGRADVLACITFNAKVFVEYRLDVAVEAPLCLGHREILVIAEFDFDLDARQRIAEVF